MNIYDKLYGGRKYNKKVGYKLDIVKDWLDEFKPKKVLDMGCGRGHYIKHLINYKVTGVEASKYLCTKYGWQSDTILTHKGKYDALYCMDVLEHISPEELEANLKALSKLAPKALLGIANHKDIWEGVELHLIQEDVDWWKKRIEKHYNNVKTLYEDKRYYIFVCSV